MWLLYIAEKPTSAILHTGIWQVACLPTGDWSILLSQQKYIWLNHWTWALSFPRVQSENRLCTRYYMVNTKTSTDDCWHSNTLRVILNKRGFATFYKWLEKKPFPSLSFKVFWKKLKSFQILVDDIFSKIRPWFESIQKVENFLSTSPLNVKTPFLCVHCPGCHAAGQKQTPLSQKMAEPVRWNLVSI
mgnify:CR=1 FL=1